MCAFQTLVQLQQYGDNQYYDILTRDRNWKTHMHRWAQDDNGYVSTHDAVSDYIKCMKVLQQKEKQEHHCHCHLVKVTFPKALFVNLEHAVHFIYTMAQNLPCRGLTFDILHILVLDMMMTLLQFSTTVS